MAEIKKLDMDLEIVGWDRSGGRSLNVWGRVPFPKELYDLIKINEKHGRKASIWTAYDSALYGKNAYTLEELPRISATYKSCFEKYSAVVENMGMRIAAALDMPTSYNYIVAFNPEDYPKVISNYPNPEKKLKELQPFGIVSIDFLQNQRTKPIVTKTDYEVDGETKEIDSIREFEKDILITFDDALRKYNFSGAYTNTDNRGNLIENWISVVDEMAKVELKGCPRETINKTISNIHSRIARAFLLREFLGDCDFTAYNGGIVYNPATKKMRYAPNHDYGEVCNPLVAKKLSKPIDSLCGMTQEAFDQLPDAVKQAIIRGQQKKNNATIPEIAQEFASSTSAENFNYVLENFPEACKEFFENLDKLVQVDKIRDIVKSYTEMTVNDTPLLTEEEANMFVDFLELRADHMCQQYVDFLEANHQEIPQAVASQDEKEL